MLEETNVITISRTKVIRLCMCGCFDEPRFAVVRHILGLFGPNVASRRNF